ncbi:hypothetical protein pb186bvf_015464 [Paramecium bursaria]
MLQMVQLLLGTHRKVMIQANYKQREHCQGIGIMRNPQMKMKNLIVPLQLDSQKTKNGTSSIYTNLRILIKDKIQGGCPQNQLGGIIECYGSELKYENNILFVNEMSLQI